MIHVENLSKYYDSFCAVDQISLNIKRGEIVGLLGPNGAGKTTTLRMLTGYFPPTSGKIRIKDFAIEDDLLAVKSLIGYLPESAPLYKGMLVFDYLEHVARIRGLQGDAKFKRLRELADMCGLRSIMHKTIYTLSKGLKQRVGLAHAMMSDPEILILDEPTSGLDPNQIVEIREIIRNIGKQKTIILSTHILSEAEATCDRIVIIDKGKIVADGTTQELKADMGTASWIFIGLLQADFDAVRTALQTVQGVQGVERADSSDPEVTRVKIGCAHGNGVRTALYAAIKATDWVLVEMQQDTQNLETIFRNLTGEN